VIYDEDWLDWRNILKVLLRVLVSGVPGKELLRKNPRFGT
jgi:hypothetical protein